MENKSFWPFCSYGSLRKAAAEYDAACKDYKNLTGERFEGRKYYDLHLGLMILVLTVLFTAILGAMAKFLGWDLYISGRGNNDVWAEMIGMTFGVTCSLGTIGILSVLAAAIKEDCQDIPDKGTGDIMIVLYTKSRLARIRAETTKVQATVAEIRAYNQRRHDERVTKAWSLAQRFEKVLNDIHYYARGATHGGIIGSAINPIYHGQFDRYEIRPFQYEDINLSAYVEIRDLSGDLLTKDGYDKFYFCLDDEEALQKLETYLKRYRALKAADLI